jgi:catechol 2,3-dioxygenase-like lactoylglutathione lyase family enzyme
LIAINFLKSAAIDDRKSTYVNLSVESVVSVPPRSALEEPVSRLQLALNVNDIDTAVEFYSTLFDSAPVKRRPGYANFAIDNPALKLILFENPEQTGTLNHLGVERESMEEVEAEANRLQAAGLALDVEGDVVCCYARQDKHWVTGPDGQQWENYVVLADAHSELEGKTALEVSDLRLRDDSVPASGGCCGTTGPAGDSGASVCCAG